MRREGLKALARGLARLAVMPIVASYRVRSLLAPEQAFRSSSQLLSLFPGMSGDYLRRNSTGWSCPTVPRARRSAFGTIFSSAAARVGENVYIGAYCINRECHHRA
jgi:hypothetical protein